MDRNMFARYRHARMRGYKASAALTIARREASEGKPAPWYGGVGYYRHKGNWGEDGAWYCDNGAAPFRNAEDAEKPFGSRGQDRRGYYCDEFQDNVCVPMVALISGRGWIPGMSWTDQDGETWFPREAYSERDEASRAADHHAERYAENEREYQQGWREGQEAREAWRKAMGDAVETIGAARTMLRAARKAVTLALAARSGEDLGFLPPGKADDYRAMYRQDLESMREKVAAACEARRDAWRAWWNAHPGRAVEYQQNPYRAGWHDGASEA